MQILLWQKWKSWGRQDQEATRLRLKQERGRGLKICARKREKRVSGCLKTWWKRREEEIPDSGTEWHEGWDEENPTQTLFSRSGVTQTIEYWGQTQPTPGYEGLLQGLYVLWGFRHLAELRLNEQSSYNTREIQTAETLARTWKDQPSFFITEC